MTKYNEPTLETVQHGYPFLLDYVFNPRNDMKQRLDLVQLLINEYCARHIRRAVTKKGSSLESVLELLMREIRAGHAGKDMYGDTAASITELLSKRYVTIKSDFDGMAALRLKRFGECLGIEPVDSSGHRHELGTELFESMAQPRDDGGFSYLHPFVHAWLITMPRWQAHGGRKVDVAAELASAALYVPDVEWMENADEAIAKLLEDCYIATSRGYNGVEVGRYHGIPIRMQVLFGDERSDQVWRRGAISRDGAKLLFDNQSNNSVYIRYVIRTVDENNMFQDAATGINYIREQNCLRRLSKILLDAFSARDLAETIAREPLWVAWKLKEPQVEAATA